MLSANAPHDSKNLTQNKGRYTCLYCPLIIPKAEYKVKGDMKNEKVHTYKIYN